ncbi:MULTISPECIES: tyrosine-type recombinase/integrase [Pseudonocardia]|uniref:Prophage phiRv2 integrase n=2 Tax=Pseudonocardia TaxID=1847 RepID=A0ABQ0S0E1_9PSEU|nr:MULTISPECIES: tyrosine-type recombinase/integrase [Pseudonocardia]OSY38019.1 putative prophage phiRv2 integrase [Pseudonocardia autotrophica]TDN74680.1 integrase [Pseudonocardia autotrophica]BBG05451.1 putative prophage phiRv2 integrase [Pseudonocardia autotrophica]GEC26377.1 putative prophage phiRv2 integrase [Pseudonocardia saturnea]
MGNRRGHRRFGHVRKLPSGRYQASYLGPDGQRRTASTTFARKADADVYLSRVEATISQGEWTDPSRAKVRLVDYAESWVEQRAGLRPRTVELYRWLLARHIVPTLGGVALGELTTALVRQWRADLLVAGVSQTMAAKAYRLLRAVLNTAVEEDRILTRNPCRVRGADQENPAERPVLTLPQVFELADAMRYRRLRMLIIVTAFATLRWGEATALRRQDVAPDGSWLRVSVAHTEVVGRGIVVGPPKSRAGVRTVSIPTAVRPELVEHLRTYVGPGPDALLFTGPKGGALRRAHFNNLVRWVETVKKIGAPGLHFHDLRHTGNLWAAQTGASTKDLMSRMGHDDMRAALIYQRATSSADRRIADGLSGLVDDHRRGVTRSQDDERDPPVAG